MLPPSMWSLKDLSQVWIRYLPLSYVMWAKDFPLISVSTQIHGNNMMTSRGDLRTKEDMDGDQLSWMVTQPMTMTAVWLHQGTQAHPMGCTEGCLLTE